MSKARTYIRNIAANWVGYGANLVVMFFLSPFVVHSLGNTTYGVWSLVVSVTGYLGLAELGTRAGLGRFINYYLGRGEIDKVNGVVSSALAFFAACGVILAIGAVTLGAFFGTLFPKVPEALVADARIAIGLIALNLWLSFFGAAFTQILTAHERFDISNGINLVVLLVRTGGTLLVLVKGGGLVGLAAAQVLSSILGTVAAWAMAHKVFPALRLRLRAISRSHIKELFGFGIWAFVGSIAMRLLYWTDMVVIAVLLGPEHVTLYAIGGMLIIYGRQLVCQTSYVHSPGIIQHCARQDWGGLRHLIKRGSTVVMAIAIPLLVGLIVFGKEFLILWMGPQYEVSYPVLAILAASQFPAFAFMITGTIYSGLNRIRLEAGLSLAQGAINLGLTLVFVMGFKMGINGVAWGTFFPRVVFAVIGGVLALRWIQLRPREFVSSVLWRWLLLLALFSAVCACVAGLPWEARWGRFCIKVGIALAAYLPLTWAILLTEDDRLRLRRLVNDRRWSTWPRSG